MIERIAIPPSSIAATAAVPAKGSAAEVTKGFSNYLEDALEQVNQSEEAVHQLNNKFTLGEVDAHTLMIASEKAELTLQLTGQIRNKIIEAYQEIMRTQI